MKKLTRRLISGLFAASIVISSLTAVSAGELVSTSSGRSFDRAWEAYNSAYCVEMVYGYNTAWINEDYTHSMYTQDGCTAIVKNAKSTFSDSAGSQKWAKIEVCHNGSTITYKTVY